MNREAIEIEINTLNWFEKLLFSGWLELDGLLSVASLSILKWSAFLHVSLE
jgi:hypothetical protein